MNFWLPVWALWTRDLVRFWREKARVVGYVGSPLVFWLLISPSSVLLTTTMRAASRKLF